jgi:hypothetical protein
MTVVLLNYFEQSTLGLNLAVNQNLCGFRHSIGQGSWHTAYVVQPDDAKRLCFCSNEIGYPRSILLRVYAKCR